MLAVFDSGLGGLTALRELRRIVPEADIVYFGDTGRVPYGSRSRDTIIRFSRQDMRFLSSVTGGAPDAVLVACGTVSSTALDELRKETHSPLIGVVEDAAKAAAAATRNGVVAVLGTSATVTSGAYGHAIKAVDPKIRVIQQACPLFVPLVENGFVNADDEITKAAVKRYLDPVAAVGPDTVILGCTHFPIIADAIRDALPRGVRLINSGAEAAKSAAAYAKKESGRVKYYVSDAPGSFGDVARIFLGTQIDGDVEVVDIDKY